jgi:hypothetical protein
MQCQTCGEELREGARFCPTCGTPTATGGASVTPPTIQIRRPSTSAPVAPPDLAPPELTAEEQTTARVEPPRLSRDPGAGYDPVGPPRVAPGVRPARPPASSGGSAGGSAFVAPTSADFNTLLRRIGRLLRLDTSVFGEVYADRSATIPAAIFGAVVLLISGIGGMLLIANSIGFDIYGSEFGDGHGAGEFFLLSVFLGTVIALAMTAAWAWITAFLLDQLAKADVDWLGIFRLLCFALTPLVLAVLLVFDDGYQSLGYIAIAGVATLALIGVLESVDARPGHAWLATLVGLIVFVIVLDLLGDSTRDLAPGFFAL